MIQVYNKFSDIKAEWDYLYSISNFTVFQSYDYNLISWSFFPNRGMLYILCYRCSDRNIKLIFPTYIDKRGTLRFINDVGTDICNMVYDHDLNLYDVMKEICLYIISQKEVKSISLENLQGDSPILSYFKVFFPNSIVFSNNEVSFLECRRCDDPIASFKHLTNDKRKKLKKILKHEDEYKFDILSIRNNDLFPLASLIKIANLMVKKKIRSEATFENNFWEYVKELYNHGLLEIAIIYDNNNTALSAGLVFVNEQISVRWVILYTEPQYNLWNNIMYINVKGKERDYINNFGRGGYDYKMINFKPQISPLYKVIVPNSKSGILYSFRNILKYVLNRFSNHTMVHNVLSRLKIQFSNFKRKL